MVGSSYRDLREEFVTGFSQKILLSLLSCGSNRPLIWRMAHAEVMGRIVIILIIANWSGFAVHAMAGVPACLEEHDSEHNELAFLAETSTVVYSTECEYRVLQCRSVNFCRIQWFFNGIPYDSWRLGTDSDTKYYLEDNNQTIKFHSADVDAEGSFTCVVSNGQRNISRSINLRIQEGIWLNRPIPYQSSSIVCKDQTAVLGGNASFFCQFKYRNPGAFFQYSWRKLNETYGGYELVDFYEAPGTEFSYDDKTDNENFTQTKKCPGKPPKILSTWLNITNVTEKAIGRYQVHCRIAQFLTKVNLTLVLATTNEPIVVTNTSSVVILVIMMAILVFLFVFSWKRYGTDIKLLYHDHRAKLETEDIDNKVYDAYIVSCYQGQDKAFIDNILCPSLKDQYSLFVRERDQIFGSVESEEIIEAMTKSRRCIVVLSADFYRQSSTSSSQSTSGGNLPLSSSPSPSVGVSGDDNSGNEWHLFELHYALDTMHPHVIPLLYRDSGPTSLSKTDSNAELIDHVLKDVECIKWKQKDETRLDDWAMKQLRLRLPPRRRGAKFTSGQLPHLAMPSMPASSLSINSSPQHLTSLSQAGSSVSDRIVVKEASASHGQKLPPAQSSQLSFMSTATSPSLSAPMSLSSSLGSCSVNSPDLRSFSHSSSSPSPHSPSSAHFFLESERDNLNSFQEYDHDDRNMNKLNFSRSIFKIFPGSKREQYLIDNEAVPGYI